jgi:hypothetical protein
LDFIKFGKFLDQMRHYQLIEEYAEIEGIYKERVNSACSRMEKVV